MLDIYEKLVLLQNCYLFDLSKIRIKDSGRMYKYI